MIQSRPVIEIKGHPSLLDCKKIQVKMFLVSVMCFYFLLENTLPVKADSNSTLRATLTGSSYRRNNVKIPTKNSVNKNDIEFLLYTSNNPTYPIRLFPGNISGNEISTTNIFVGSNLKMAFHGFGANAREKWLPKIKDEYMKAGRNNVILVDWSKLCQKITDLSLIPNVYMTAKYSAMVLDSLAIASLIKMADVHIIGHSLGAHVASMTANLIKTGTVGRITGLDPNKIVFETFGDDYGIDRSDAPMVDIIHTDGGTIGVQVPRGTVDFYPNGGKSPQPGCFGHLCSHSRAPELYIASINNPTSFKACKCNSYEEYHRMACPCDIFTYMGEYASRVSNGSYFLQTSDTYPFNVQNQSTDTFIIS